MNEPKFDLDSHMKDIYPEREKAAASLNKALQEKDWDTVGSIVKNHSRMELDWINKYALDHYGTSLYGMKWKGELPKELVELINSID